MVAKYRDPVAAAKHVVAEAYRLWLTFDERTDDITIIIVYFDDIVADTTKKNVSIQPSPISGDKQFARSSSIRVAPDGSGGSGVVLSLSAEDCSSELQIESRPVRTVMSKARRKEISELLEDEKEEFDFSKVVDTKVTPNTNHSITLPSNHHAFLITTLFFRPQQIYSALRKCCAIISCSRI